MKKIRLLFVGLISAFVLVSCTDKKVNEEQTTTKVNVTINTADDALSELKNGNKRFIDKKFINTNYEEQIEKTKEKQTPHTVILSCMDSRVPPEIIFDQGIGNIFVVRNAGNIEDENVLGSMEYAVKFAGAKLIVVMGHSHCGAVKGTIANVQDGNLTQLVEQIKPAIPTDKETINIEETTVKNNVKITIQDILSKSSIIKEMVNSNKIKIVSAFYDIETGNVVFE